MEKNGESTNEKRAAFVDDETTANVIVLSDEETEDNNFPNRGEITEPQNEKVQNERLPGRAADSTLASSSLDHAYAVPSPKLNRTQRRRSEDRKGIPKSYYPLVFLHVEYLRTDKTEKAEITQIGCSHANPQRVRSLFQSVCPQSLPKLLQSYKLTGNLLKALNLTQENNGKYQFRKEFEFVEESKKVFAVDEETAIRNLIQFLSSLSKEAPCIIVGVDEDTISLLV